MRNVSALIIAVVFVPALHAAADREAARNVVMIPVAGTVPGANDTNFQTDLTVADRGGNGTRIDVYWLPQDRSGTNTPIVRLQLEPFGTATYPDFVRAVLRQQGLGAIILRAVRDDGTPVEDARIDAYARVWNPLPTRGTTSVGIQASTLYGPKVDDFQPIRGHIYGLRQDANFRSNVGIVNMGPRPMTFAVYVNTSVVPVTVIVQPFSMMQRPLPAGDFGPVWLAIEPFQETPARLDLGPWTAYGTSVDNFTGDAWFSKAQAARLHQDPL